MLREKQRRLGMRLGCLALLTALCGVREISAIELKKNAVPDFGTTFSLPGCLRGRVYHIPVDSPWIPDLTRQRYMGTVFTCMLDVPARDYLDGMPGVTDRIEWFAIDYEGDFWIDKPGDYRWSLTSDDGSRLYIDGKSVIDNDRTHAPETVEGHIKLEVGKHHIHVPYFQGPRYTVALVLQVQGPGDKKFRIFDVRQFAPRDDPGEAVARAQAAETADARPTLRRTENGYKAFEMIGLDALNMKPRPHAFDYALAALRFPTGSSGAAYSIAFEIPGENVTTVPATEPGRQNLRVSLLALVKDANAQLVQKVSLNFDRDVSSDQLSALRRSSLNYTEPIVLPPGRFSVETAVVDAWGKRSSTNVFEVENTERRGVAISSLVLVQRVEPLPPGKLDPNDPLEFEGKRVIPEVATRLGANAHPYLYFVVYPDPANKEKPKITVQMMKSGRVLARQDAELPPPNESGRIPMIIGTVPEPGDYRLSVIASQGRDSVEQTVAYSISGK
jgi:hypothetical protein